jgi:hypothetical protein
MRNRAFVILDVVFLGAAVVFAFGASDHGHLEPWMVILLLIGVGHCLAAACWISLPTTWKIIDWNVPISGQLKWCGAPEPSVDQCIERILEDGQDGIKHNARVLNWKRRVFISMFVMLAALIAMAVVLWVTLGTGA